MMCMGERGRCFFLWAAPCERAEQLFAPRGEWSCRVGGRLGVEERVSRFASRPPPRITNWADCLFFGRARAFTHTGSRLYPHLSDLLLTTTPRCLLHVEASSSVDEF